MFGGSVFRLFRWRGVDVYMDITALLIIGIYVIQLGSGGRGTDGLVIAVSVGLLVIGSILVHELSHAAVGMWLGAKVERIQLSVLGGVCVFSSKVTSNWRDFLISVAGPAANFALFFIFTFSANPDSGGIWYPISYYVAQINLLLGIFNILPGYPLDGGQALRSLVIMITKREVWAAWAVAISGCGVGAFLGYLGITGLQSGGGFSIFYIFIAIWIIMGSIGQFQSTQRFTGQAQRFARPTQRQKNTPIAAVPPPPPAAEGILTGAVADRVFPTVYDPNLTVADFLARSENIPDTLLIPVLQNGFLAGLTTRAAVSRMSPANQQTFTLEKVMIPRRQIQSVYDDEDLSAAREALKSSRGQPLVVLDRGGAFVGFISFADMEKVRR
jgi:Zn-dependent protease